MTRRIIASLAAVGVAILASCSQDKSPSALLPTEASQVRTPPAPSCSFSTANQYAKNYFTNTSGPTKDQVFTLLAAMQQVATTGGNASETSAGFDVLTRVAAAAGTGAVKTGAEAQGSAFVNEVVLCMVLKNFVYASGQFTSALSSGGLFAVVANASTNYIRARSGRFGAEPTTTDGWPITSGRALFYGAPLANQSTLSKETLIGGTAFSLNTLPTPLTFSPLIRVGICDIAYEEGSSTIARILHVHSGSPVVLATDAPTFCPSSFTSRIDAPSSMFASTAYHLASWLSPKPAYAAPVTTCCKLGGGTVGGLSDIGTIAPQDTIIFDHVPDADVSDSTAGKDSIFVGTPPVKIADTTTTQFQPEPVTVQVLTKASKAPIGGVLVHLMVINNKGSYEAFGGTATTDAQGYARFPNFYINKAGGYTVSAQADKDEFGPNSFIAYSNLFNISGQ